MKRIPTLFKRKYDDEDKFIGVLPEITEGCEKAFLHGKATIKYVGSCCAIINGELYKRFRANEYRPVPDGAIKCQEEPDSITKTLPCWVKCNRNNPDDKRYWLAYDNTLNDMKDYIDISKVSLLDGTYEACGEHFKNNPMELPYDVLIPHGKTELNVERTFEGVRYFLSSNFYDGIVF